jgi:hypothetical protein
MIERNEGAIAADRLRAGRGDGSQKGTVTCAVGHKLASKSKKHGERGAEAWNPTDVVAACCLVQLERAVVDDRVY